jgi:hypothetical protein
VEELALFICPVKQLDTTTFGILYENVWLPTDYHWTLCNRMDVVRVAALGCHGAI